MKKIIFIPFLLSLFIANISWAQKSFPCKAPYSLTTAQQVYDIVVRPSFGMDYKNARNGCYERAEKVNSLLVYNNIAGLQAFIQTENPASCGATGASCINGSFAGANESPIIVFDSPYSSAVYEWDYHTTATICIKHNGKSELYALDPSTFLKPVPLRIWMKVLSQGLATNEYSTLVREFR